MSNLESIIVGLFLGFIGVGLPTLRTMRVMDGNYISVFFISLCSTATLFVFTNMVILRNYSFMTANAIGAACAVSVLAWRRRK